MRDEEDEDGEVEAQTVTGIEPNNPEPKSDETFPYEVLSTEAVVTHTEKTHGEENEHLGKRMLNGEHEVDENNIVHLPHHVARNFTNRGVNLTRRDDLAEKQKRKHS